MEFATLLFNPGNSDLPQIETTEQIWNLAYSMTLLTFSGFVVKWFLEAVSYAYNSLRKNLTCSIKITSKEEVFKMVRHYLTEEGYLKGNMADLKVLEKKKKNTYWWDYDSQDAQQNKKVEVDFLPGAGDHIFTYKGQKMWMSIYEEQTLLTGWDNKPKTYETLNITTYGQDTKLLKEIVLNAIDYQTEKDTSLVKIYQVHRWGGSWHMVNQKKPRSQESVILDSDIAERVIADIRKFQNGAKEYLDKEVPYRRGYLLYGPPGTGKTSFVQVVAAAVKLDICYLNLSGGYMDDDGLNNLLSQAPDRAIILLEDIDAIFVQRTSMQEQKSTVTFSGLLNALDGIRSQEGRILIMTTNHKEKLDPALLRPGRADLHVELNYASESQIAGLLKKFFPEATDTQTQAFLSQLPEFKLSMAKLQGHFLKYRDNIDLAIENAKSLLDKEEQEKDMSINEWLRRLNLNQFAHKFKKLSNVKFVQDLKYISDADLIEYGMDKLTDRRRVMEMIRGDQDTKLLFQLQNRLQARGIVTAFVNDDKEIEDILDIIGEEQITGWQIKDIFDSNKDLDIIKQNLYLKIKQNQTINDGGHQIMEEEEKFIEETEKEAEEAKKKEYPRANIAELLKEIGYEDCIPKLEEKDIADPEIFFGFSVDEMISHLGIEKEGKKYKFKKQMKEIQEKHEKKIAEAEEEKIQKKIGGANAFELLQKRSTVVF